MLVCLGATLTVLLSLYEFTMVTGPWSNICAEIGIKTDVSRFGAQVINGIGFLGAGTILVTGRQQVKGLTTAAGLWASACTGTGSFRACSSSWQAGQLCRCSASNWSVSGLVRCSA